MRLFLCLALVLVTGAAWAGEDNAKPWLGVSFDTPAASGTVFADGLPVFEVKADSPAAAMGMQAGDHIVSFNGAPVTSMKELQAAMDQATVGSEATVVVARSNAEGVRAQQTLKGVLKAKPKRLDRGEITQRLKELEDKLAAVERQRKKPLEEVLTDLANALKAVEDQLPGAAEQFKRRYPNGTFSVKISVDISSDTTAKSPVEVQPKAPEPKTPERP
jgi:membrane-associated protease RseP (regulator of RpoE activity)